MPSGNQLKRYAFAFILFFVTANLGLFAFDYFQKKSSPQKQKPPLRLSSFANGGPVQKLFTLNLNYEAAESDENQVVEIKAKIKVPFNYHFPVAYSWKLSPDVILVEGSLQGELKTGISVNEDAVIKIKVKNFTKKTNRHLWFEAKSVTAGHALYGEVMAASDLENTFENIVQNVERIKASE